MESHQSPEEIQALSQSIIDSSDDAIISKTLEGIITSWNHGAKMLFGYSAEEAIGKHISMLIPDNRLNEESEIIEKIKQGKNVKHYETERKRKDGSLAHISLTISPIKNSTGKIIGASKIARDISERIETERMLRKSLLEIADYKFALDESSILAITDQKGIIKSVNDNFCKISKYNREELIGQDHRIINSGYHPKEFIRNLWVTIANGKIWKGELKNKAKDGAIYWVDTTIVPFLNEEGKPYQYVAIRADITGRKNAEAEVINASREKESVLNRINDSVVSVDNDWRYTFLNDAALSTHPLSRQETIGKVIWDVHPEMAGTIFWDKYHQAMNTGKVVEIEDYYAPMDIWFSVKVYPSSDGLTIFYKDITERKKAEEKILTLNEELEKRERRFRSLIENSSDLVSLMDGSFKAFYRSPSSERITGWTDQDRGGESGMMKAHPDDMEYLKTKIEEVMNAPGKPVEVSFQAKHKDGHYMWIEGVVINMLHDESLRGIVTNFRDVTEKKMAEDKLIKSEKIYKTIASSIPDSVICLLDTDFRYLLIEGDMLEKLGYFKEKLLGNKAEDVLSSEVLAVSLKELKKALKGEATSIESSRHGYDTISRYIPLKDENDLVYAIMTVSMDVTRLKNAQREVDELNKGLEQKVADRTTQLQEVNKELESFSYSVSHDLRAPLRTINGYAEMLEEDYHQVLDGEGIRLLKVITESAVKMGVQIDDLLEFSRLGRKELRKTEVNMNELMKMVIAGVNESTPNQCDIKTGQLLPAMADYSLMEHVLCNLFSNAVKYSSKKEKPAIEIKSEQKDGSIIYSIRDNGAGFEMEYAHKLFGVFQRLHSQEEFAGTGVGLAIVQRIVQKHNGKVWAEGKPGEGATFYFSLPINS